MNILLFFLILPTVHQESGIIEYTRIKSKFDSYIFNIQKAIDNSEDVRGFIERNSALYTQSNFKTIYFEHIAKDLKKITVFKKNQINEISGISKRLSEIAQLKKFNKNTLVELQNFEHTLVDFFGKCSFTHLKFSEFRLNISILFDPLNQNQIYSKEINKEFESSLLKNNPELYLIKYFDVQFEAKNKNTNDILDKIEKLYLMVNQCNSNKNQFKIQLAELKIKALLSLGKVKECFECFKMIEIEIQKGVNQENYYFISKIYSSMSSIFLKIGNIEEAIKSQKIVTEILSEYAPDFENDFVIKEFITLKKMYIKNGLKPDPDFIEHDKKVKAYLDIEGAKSEFELAQSSFNSKDFTKAEECATRSISYDNYFILPYELRGKISLIKKNHTEAIGDFSKAIEIDGNYAELYYLRGICWRWMAVHELAVLDFTKGIQLSPNDHRMFFLRGLSFLDLEFTDKALIDFDLSICHNPNHTNSYLGKAHALLAQSKFPDSINIFNIILAKDPANYEAIYGISKALHKQGKTQEAISGLNKCIKLDPENHSAYFDLSLIYSSCENKKLRNGSIALELAKKYALFDDKKNNWQCYYALGSAHFELGNKKDAIENQRKAVELLNQKNYFKKEMSKTLTELLNKYLETK